MRLLLAAWLLAAQSVSLADCCCGSFCERKNECTGCVDGASCAGGKAKASCCDGEEREVCSHLEPSSELERSSPGADVVPPPLVLWLPAFEPPVLVDDPIRPTEAGPDPPRRRHLSLSVLRI